MQVATLIANRKEIDLSAEIIDEVKIALVSRCEIHEVKILSDLEAADIFFTGENAEDIIRTELGERQIDVIVQPAEKRQKKLLISDMDSTLIVNECIDEIADLINIKDKVAAITEKAMRGEYDFAESLIERVALLKGVDAKLLEQVYQEKIKFTDGAKELVSAMKANGAYAIVVSGGFTFFANKVRDELGCDEALANILEIEEGKLTGHVARPIIDAESKLKKMQEIMQQKNIHQDEVLAIGDGANDLPMLKASGLGVAFHAKDIVKAQAAAQLNYTSLRALIFTQGIVL